MHYQTFVPVAPLSEYVGWFWHFEGLDVPHRRERVLPDGTAELVINLDDSRRKLFDREEPHRFQTFRRAWLSGARSDYILIDVVPHSSMVGIHFKPGGLTPFLSMPASELTGRVVELDAIFGPKAGELREALLEADGSLAKFSVLERFLCKRVVHQKSLPWVARALQAFEQDDSPGRVREVADAFGASHKHFIEMFRREVGLTPKRFCRVRRFQRVLAAIHRREEVDWADTASGAGYYDQAHFAHDFRAFSGLTPSDYLARRNGELNFVPADT